MTAQSLPCTRPSSASRSPSACFFDFQKVMHDYFGCNPAATTTTGSSLPTTASANGSSCDNGDYEALMVENEHKIKQMMLCNNNINNKTNANRKGRGKEIHSRTRPWYGQEQGADALVVKYDRFGTLRSTTQHPQRQDHNNNNSNGKLLQRLDYDAASRNEYKYCDVSAKIGDGCNVLERLKQKKEARRRNSDSSTVSNISSRSGGSNRSLHGPTRNDPSTKQSLQPSKTQEYSSSPFSFPSVSPMSSPETLPTATEARRGTSTTNHDKKQDKKVKKKRNKGRRLFQMIIKDRSFGFNNKDKGNHQATSADSVSTQGTHSVNGSLCSDKNNIGRGHQNNESRCRSSPPSPSRSTTSSSSSLASSTREIVGILRKSDTITSARTMQSSSTSIRFAQGTRFADPDQSKRKRIPRRGGANSMKTRRPSPAPIITTSSSLDNIHFERDMSFSPVVASAATSLASECYVFR